MIVRSLVNTTLASSCSKIIINDMFRPTSKTCDCVHILMKIFGCLSVVWTCTPIHAWPLIYLDQGEQELNLGASRPCYNVLGRWPPVTVPSEDRRNQWKEWSTPSTTGTHVSSTVRGVSTTPGPCRATSSKCYASRHSSSRPGLLT